MYRAIKIQPGLQLELTQGRTTYRARAHLKGRVGYFATETGDEAVATARALAWFRQWSGDRPTHLMREAARLHGASFRPHQAAAQADFEKRWSAIRGVHGLGKADVAEVTASYLRAFAIARGDIAASTAKKDWDTIRPILRVAKAEGWITDLPTFPTVRLQRNPRMPFTAAELRTLLEASTEPMVTDFLRIVVFGLLRPYEVWRLSVEDVADHQDQMRVHVRRKTGITHAPVPMRFPALREAIRRRIEVVGQGRLFPVSAEWFPRRFSTLLDATGLRQPLGGSCRPRDSWSLRATGICLEIKRQRRKHGAADYLRIARWAGTSVARIDAHYAAFLA